MLYSFYLALGAAILFNSLANFLMKKASGGHSVDALLQPFFMAAVLCFGMNLIFYSRSLKGLPLSLAYPVLVGGSLLLVTLVSWYFGEEVVDARRIAGIGLLILGLLLLV